MKEKQSRKATKPSIEEEPVKKKKVVGKGISVQQKGNVIEKEFRSQIKSLQSSIRNSKLRDDWDDVGDSFWMKLHGDKEHRHIVIKAVPKGRKYEFTLFGLFPEGAVETRIDSISVAAESNNGLSVTYSFKDESQSCRLFF